MLQKLADRIAVCFERASAFERRASEAADPEIRQSYDEIAKAWRHLAASYQFSESLERFLLDRDLAKKPPAPSLPAANSARPWLTMDDVHLRNGVEIGCRTDEIAESLGRKVEDVRARARELGLTLPDGASDAA